MSTEPDTQSSADTGSAAQRQNVRSRALEWVVASRAVDQVFGEVRSQLQRRHRRRIAATGALLTVIIGLGTLWHAQRSLPPTLTRPATASVARPVREALPDGSVVELKHTAKIDVEFNAEIRRVVLRQGEAYFAVVPDPARPFIVAAGNVEVRAVGTAFSVGLDHRSVDILVSHGRVAVEKPVVASAPSQELAPLPRLIATLDAGARVVVAASSDKASAVASQLIAVTAEELNARLAWRVPRLEFAGTPLVQAVALFNQHAAERLIIRDPNIEAVELSGIIRADNVDSLLRLLADEFEIESDRQGNEISLRKSGKK